MPEYTYPASSIFVASQAGHPAVYANLSLDLLGDMKSPLWACHGRVS